MVGLVLSLKTLNINILHAVYVCIKWKRGWLFIMFMIQAEELLLTEQRN